MKNRILAGCAGLLLASSTMFAGWGDRDDHRHERYEHRGGVYLGVGPSYSYGYATPAPYADPYAGPYGYGAPYVNGYAAPAPYYGGVWVGGRWRDRDYRRDWDRDHDRGRWGNRR